MASNGLISLTDAVWCERHSNWLPSFPPGGTAITVERFISLVGWLFVVSTVVVVGFKSEGKEVKEPPRTKEADSGAVISPQAPSESGLTDALRSVRETARLGLSLFSLPSVQVLCLVLISRKAGCAVVDAGLGLKLQEYGMPKVSHH